MLITSIGVIEVKIIANIILATIIWLGIVVILAVSIWYLINRASNHKNTEIKEINNVRWPDCRDTSKWHATKKLENMKYYEGLIDDES